MWVAMHALFRFMRCKSHLIVASFLVAYTLTEKASLASASSPQRMHERALVFISPRRLCACRMKVEGGVVGRYVHASPSDGGTAGRMVAIVGLSCSRGPLVGEVAREAQHLGDQLAMHIVAMRPKYLSRASGTS